jgi:hypothetical protein
MQSRRDIPGDLQIIASLDHPDGAADFVVSTRSYLYCTVR